MNFVSRPREFRSSLADYPGANPPAQPTVGIVAPIFNEMANLDQFLNDLLSQDYPAIQEIWFVDGGSSDGAFEALQAYAREDSRIKVARNPKRLPAAAINIAFRAMQSDIFFRLDAHARYERDVVRASVEALLATGAGGVGAIARPAPGRTMIERAIVAAHKSRFGVGVARFRREGSEGWVDSVWNGCYWRHVVERVGLLREDFHRMEDNDFNARVRQAGYGLYLSPHIHTYYQPRRTLRSLWTQYFSNGEGVSTALFDNPGAVAFRHFAPLALVVALVAPLLLSLVFAWTICFFVAALLVYGLALIAAVAETARVEKSPPLLLFVVLPAIHFSYGLGTLFGLYLRASHRLKEPAPLSPARGN